MDLDTARKWDKSSSIYNTRKKEKELVKMQIIKSRGRLFIVVALVWLISAQVQAQDAVQVDTITITANKMEENIQDVAGSVSALSEMQIEDAGINSFNDIHIHIPNFSSYASGNMGGYDSIRGQTNLITSSRAVGIYVDDVPAILSSWTKLTNLYETERIEVLRGPQGNLYGLNSAGGVVNIITKKPGNTFRANATAEYGNYDLRSYKASVSGPVVKDKLFMGFAGKYKTRDSYIEEEGADTHKDNWISGRFQMRWVPLDTTNILFTSIDEDSDSDHGVWVPKDSDPFKIKNMGLDEKGDTYGNIRSLRIKHHTPWFDLTSITAKVSGESQSVGGKDFVSGGANLKYMVNDQDSNKWMQELRFASTDKENAFQWILGGFYLKGEEDTNGNFCKDTGTIDAPTGIYADDITESEIETDIFSLFGQAGYTFQERLTITAGLRYDRDKKETDFLHNANGTVIADYEASTTWDAVSPKLVVDFRANDSIMTYVSVAKGYKSGGYSSHMGDTPEDAMFDPEYAWSYETGVKTNWLNNRIIANMCGFYTTVDDIQIMYTDPDTWQMSYKNAAEATLWGIELETIFRPFAGLQVMASFGLLETELEKHEIREYEGNRVPFASDYNAGLVIQYNSPWGIYIRGEGSWFGKSYFGEDNKYSQEAYMIANSKIGYETENFNINFYIKNAFDKTYYNFVNCRGGVEKGILGTPLTCGVQATLRF